MRRLNLLGAQVTDESMDFSPACIAGGLESYRTPMTNSGLASLQSLKNLTDWTSATAGSRSNGVEALRAACPR